MRSSATSSGRRTACRALLAGALLLLLGAAAYPPPPSGPALRTDPSALANSVTCPDGLAHRSKPVVLLVHGTATTAEETWPLGLGTSLPLAGFDWCMVQLPDRALGDIQDSNEYVVAAVRRLARLTRRRVDLVGHSQGGLQTRWAIRWWPDLRKIVEDDVTFAGSNQGVASAAGTCALGSCFPSAWQQRTGSALEAALNRRRMPAGPAYTALHSATDELVQPASSGTFAGASNILIQDQCPGRYVGHVQAVFDAVYIADALDALRHRGPVSAARAGSAPCSQVYGPGIDPAQASAAIATLYANAAAAVARHPQIRAEPPLRAYARSG
jgi:pimeloyl-ACP methyl ester carboxylesterase